MAASGTFPTTAQLTEWIVWADGKIKSYLQCGSTLPTDQGDILKNVADDLLIRKYTFERLIKNLSTSEILKQPLPELTAGNKMDLDNLKGQDESIEDPAFNFDIAKTEGGFD